MYSLTQHHNLYSSYTMPSPAMPAPVATAPTRQYANHSNSSAFSSSANPDEDWTKISDLAERRRIQNRIAQRNYRKKLKRRLEDLERRAGTTDIPVLTKPGTGRATGPNGKPAKTKKQQHTLSSLSAAAAAQAQALAQAQAQAQAASQAQRQPSQSQLTPPMPSDEDLLYTHPYDSSPQLSQSIAHAHSHSHSHSHSHGRRSHSPIFTTSSAYSTYPPPEDSGSIPSTSSSSSIASAPSRAADYRGYRAYEYNDWAMAATVPVTLPSLNHFTDGLALKRESMDDSLSGGDSVAAAAAAAAGVAVTVAPYISTYGFLSTTGIDSVNAYDSNPHTPPLSTSYDHSASCSDAGYEYPTTPLSMASPMMRS